jgi:hypothetical protein
MLGFDQFFMSLAGQDFEAARTKALSVGAKKFFLEARRMLLRSII